MRRREQRPVGRRARSRLLPRTSSYCRSRVGDRCRPGGTKGASTRRSPAEAGWTTASMARASGRAASNIPGSRVRRPAASRPAGDLTRTSSGRSSSTATSVERAGRGARAGRCSNSLTRHRVTCTTAGRSHTARGAEVAAWAPAEGRSRRCRHPRSVWRDGRADRVKSLQKTGRQRPRSHQDRLSRRSPARSCCPAAGAPASSTAARRYDSESPQCRHLSLRVAERNLDDGPAVGEGPALGLDVAVVDALPRFDAAMQRRSTAPSPPKPVLGYHRRQRSTVRAPASRRAVASRRRVIQPTSIPYLTTGLCGQGTSRRRRRRVPMPDRAACRWSPLA